MTVYQLITDVWRVHRGVVEKSNWFREVVQLLLRVGLGPEHADRYPRSFSGGQLQRISIARALAARPKLIVCDEAVSALDVSIQAQILNLLIDLQAEFGVAYVFISHDLGVVQHLCDRIAIMYLGKIVELGDRTQIYERPQHPYTEALLSAAPSLDDWRAKSDREIVLKGDVPSPTAPPPGCGFHPRCWNAGEGCATIEPVLGVGPSGGHVACHYPLTRTRAESSRDVGT
jgi:peptide/nickel transport system ATP-binding protein/oligopeptide transport system ATP-binding protein